MKPISSPHYKDVAPPGLLRLTANTDPQRDSIFTPGLQKQDEDVAGKITVSMHHAIW